MIPNTESTYLDRLDPAPRLGLDKQIQLLAYNAYRLGALDPAPEGWTENPAMVVALDDLTAILGRPVDFDTFADAFGDVLHAVADLDAYDTDPLGGGRTWAEAEVAKGTALADRDYHTARLVDMAAGR